MAREIERKYIVTRLPPGVDTFPREEIRQGYVALAEDGTEVRLRQIASKYYLTVKSGGDLSRDEFEVQLTESQFMGLWNAVGDRQIEKVRYLIEFAGLTVHLDVYMGRHQGLMTAEVEFASEGKAMALVPPQWFGREVTSDPQYKNKCLAVQGLPGRAGDVR